MKRAERGLAKREDLQRCTVCGRYFIRRRETVCSRTCAERLSADAPSDDPLPPLKQRRPAFFFAAEACPWPPISFSGWPLPP